MLVMNHVKKRYGNFELNCSLQVPKGCITGLIGENGAGKSTAFKAIEQLIFVDDGEIQLFGKPVQSLSIEEKRKIGIVLSGSTFHEFFTIKEVAKIMKKIYPMFEEKRFYDLCGRLGVTADKQIKHFSTGMKAKFKVAVALSHQADFLILDEPTAGLDVVARDQVLHLLREYMEERPEASILISSHIATDLESLCDDFYMIHEGKIVLHEETDVLLSEYGVLKMNEQQWENIDRAYLLRVKKEEYGYQCLTNQMRYYKENYPNVVVEKGGIDDIILLCAKGERV